MTWWQVAILSWLSFGIGYSAKPLLRRLKDRHERRRDQRRFDAMTEAQKFRESWDLARASFSGEKWLRVNDRTDIGTLGDFGTPREGQAMTITVHCGSCGAAIDVPAASNGAVPLHCPWCLKDGPTREQIQRVAGMANDTRTPAGIGNAAAAKDKP